MSALETIGGYYTREKIVVVQEVLPWASKALCKSALLESKGAVNEACCLLAETMGGLSDNEADILNPQDGPLHISESRILRSYELAEDPTTGHEGVLVQRKTFSHSSLPQANKMMEISLAGNGMLANLREIGPGVFEIPADTRFLFSDIDGVKMCFIGSFVSCYGYRVQGEELGLGSGAQLTDSVDSPTSKHGEGDTFAERPITGGSSVDITRISFRECFPLKHHPQSVISPNVEVMKNIFHRDEHSPKEKQRMAFTAAAVIGAACRSNEAQTTPCFKVFKMCRGPFVFPWKVSVDVGEYMYVGTNRGRFVPRPWIDPEDSKHKGSLQTISVLGQYNRYSLEELRFGDFLRGRTKAPHRFSLFHKLPPELRLMVWEFAREPRVVELRYNIQTTRCWTPCAPPTLLRVCHESRTDTLKHCQLTFGLPDWAPRIYFDFTIDTLFLTFENDANEEWEGVFHVETLVESLLLDDHNILDKVESLAVDANLWHFWKTMMDDAIEEWMEFDDEGEPRPELSVLPLFTQLRELKLVLNPWVGFWKQESRSSNVYDEEDFVDDDGAEFLPISRSEFAKVSGDPFCDCQLRRLQINNPDWLMPFLSFLEKA